MTDFDANLVFLTVCFALTFNMDLLMAFLLLAEKSQPRLALPLPIQWAVLGANPRMQTAKNKASARLRRSAASMLPWRADMGMPEECIGESVGSAPPVAARFSKA